MVLLVYLDFLETPVCRVFLDKTALLDHTVSQDATEPRVKEELTVFLVYMACRALPEFLALWA